jgi:hypothetical protein
MLAAPNPPQQIQFKIPLLTPGAQFTLTHVGSCSYILETKDDYYELGDILDTWYKSNLRLTEKKYRTFVQTQIFETLRHEPTPK